MEWKVEGHRQDHYWDCEIQILVLSHVFGLGGAAIRKGFDEDEPAKSKKRVGVKPSMWD
jgi:hypothetical protein